MNFRVPPRVAASVRGGVQRGQKVNTGNGLWSACEFGFQIDGQDVFTLLTRRLRSAHDRNTAWVAAVVLWSSLQRRDGVHIGMQAKGAGQLGAQGQAQDRSQRFATGRADQHLPARAAFESGQRCLGGA